MPRSRSSYLNELSTADLKQLLVARQRIDVLDKEKARLVKELAAIEKELAKLVSGVEKPARPAGRNKKTVRKIAKKAPRKKVSARKAAAPAKKKKVKKAPTKKIAAQPRLEDVVVAIIKKRGKPVSYQDIMARIKSGKLFKSKSSNFDNVLRRTLSTSKKVKRAGRGIYVLA